MGGPGNSEILFPVLAQSAEPKDSDLHLFLAKCEPCLTKNGPSRDM